MSTSKKGILLLDAILAMTILSCSLLVIIQSLTQGLQAAKFISGYTQATLVAENKWFEIMARPAITDGAQENSSVSMNDREYLVLLETRRSAADGDLFRADLTVSWMTGIRKHEIKSVRYMFQPAKPGA